MSNGKVWIVSGRYGCDLEPIEVFYSEKEAIESVKSAIYDNMLGDYSDEMEEAGINIDSIEEVLAWGEDNDYCDECTMMGGGDWHEFSITECSIDFLQLFKDVNKKDRLTRWNGNKWVLPSMERGVLREISERLAAYESTGLEPEEIVYIKAEIIRLNEELKKL
jgi:hypothetical protein